MWIEGRFVMSFIFTFYLGSWGDFGIKLSRLRQSSVDGILFNVPNSYANDGRSLFFSDHPHPVKTARNCLASGKITHWVSLVVCM